MSIPRKSDADEIRAHLHQLKNEAWLGQARRWWPEYLFRFDHIEAAARILNRGKLLSRAGAQESGAMVLDCASPAVIGATDPQWQRYARLYFRPRTPTQYHTEGFRPADRYEHGCFCPIPIVMLFDAEDILTRELTEFSEGNLAANPLTGDDADFLWSIPFRLVYHNTWFDPPERSTIIFHRHAEVMVPDELDLQALRFVGCRTQAEYETLLTLLEPSVLRRWAGKIGLGTDLNLHNRKWSFIEQVDLSSEEMVFKFNPSSLTPGPFRARVEVVEERTGKMHYWESLDFQANSKLELGLNSLTRPEKYSVRLTLDGHLAHAGNFEVLNKPV